MQNKQIAIYFEELANLLEIKGENPFRIRAYRNAARTLQSISESIAEIASAGTRELTEIQGIGKDLAEKIATIVKTQQLPQLEELRQEIPQGVVAMLRIPGIGPKKVAAIYRELHVKTLDELRVAAEQGQVASLKGFGEKTATIILEGLGIAEASSSSMYLADAKEIANEVVSLVGELETVEHCLIAGSCRRLKETVRDLDLLVTTSDPYAVVDFLAQHELVERVLARGETKQRVRLQAGIEMDIRVIPEESFGAALQYFTGSKEHNIAIRKRAVERGMKLNEYGLFQEDKLLAGATEEQIYQAVGLAWIPPELREDRGEVEWAEQQQIPQLIERQDIQGDLHMHTTASDGQGTILEMAEAARQRGLSYIAITDHSQRVSMANGLNAERLRAHWQEIDQVREIFSDLIILKGVECDILEDATMDLENDVLAEAEWVVAVLHYGLKQPGKQIMKRLFAAIECPHVCAIGHPTGRMINKRAGADINFGELFAAAAEHGVMMEINAHPKRLDLDDIHARAARDAGIPIVINTDSHHTDGFDVLRYGIYQARRAGLTANDVANTRKWEEFRKMLRIHQ